MFRLMMWTLLVSLAIASLGYILSLRWFPGVECSAVVFAAAVNLAACWVAFLPFQAVLRTARTQVPWAVLVATMIRLLLVIAATLVALLSGPWRAAALLPWMLVFYLALLAVETGYMIRLLNGLGERGKDSA